MYDTSDLSSGRRVKSLKIGNKSCKLPLFREQNSPNSRVAFRDTGGTACRGQVIIPYVDHDGLMVNSESKSCLGLQLTKAIFSAFVTT